ncbi:MAG: acetyl-CoA carboxylase carboxyltransferase subunit alpha [Myxococcota bacterium]|nr:acetyl-CoA carboxylase carboxyltransferase subunit alpha [Myxococcota bacterium]
MAVLEFERPIVELEARIRELRDLSGVERGIDRELRRLERRAVELRREVYGALSVWQRVQLSRHPDRPHFVDYLERIFEDFVELHGDRCFGDDPAIVAGLARLGGTRVAVVGQQKGRSTREKLRRNFGMAHPEGYRKAMRVMRLAARFGRPVLTFIDTPGAYPGIGAEERGQSEAIGRSLLEMAGLEVPVVATVIGEGGSGGALALGVADRVLMLEHATYSVITPEGCASILWRDAARAPEAAAQLRLLAEDALRLGIVDHVIREPEGGAHRDPDAAAENLRLALAGALAELTAFSPQALREARYRKFRAMGFVGRAD